MPNEARERLLAALKTRAFEHKTTVTIGRSHGIHAEPTTFGVKLAYAYAEFLRAIEAGEGAPVPVVFEHPETKARAEVTLRGSASMMVHRLTEDDIVRHLVGLVPATRRHSAALVWGAIALLG